MPGVWFVGCGNMGGAMLRRWLDTGLDAVDVTVIDPAVSGLPLGVAVLTEPMDVMSPPDLMVLGIKPQMLGEVAPRVSSYLGVNTLLVSILAGVRLEDLRKHFIAPHTIVRAMPNLPVAMGKGVVSLISENRAAAEDAGLTEQMQHFGLVEWMEDESQFDAVTALAGAGPAFVYRMIDALSAGGAALGLSAEQSLRMALATVEGAATMASAADVPPGELARQVASPGGATQRGLDVLDEGRALNALITATLRATAERSKEMANLG